MILKRINDRFNFFRKSDETSGSVIIMCMAVRGQGYARQYIRRWFKKLVPEVEYDNGEINDIIDYLEIQTNKESETFE